MNYELLLKEFDAILIGKFLTDMANTTAFLFENLKNINWVGFYLLEEKQLYLGPFQGKIACTIIPLGKGVCGTSAMLKKSLIVPDVHLFEGHIACDANSRSEMVIPLIKPDGSLIGVLDIDSPLIDRFHNTEENLFLETIVSQFLKQI